MELRESAADTLGMPEDQFVHELRKGIAVVLYAQERLPLSEAARLAGMAYADFMEYVTSPGLDIPYEEQEWKQDEQSLRKLGLLWLWGCG